MEGSVKELAGYRLARAREDLNTAADNLKSGSYRLREKADYDDFFLASETDASRQLENAARVVRVIERYVNERTE